MPMTAHVNLASRALGASVIAASDESFGVKERLIDPSEPAFVPGTFDLRGEVVDGWETRRHGGPAGDWVTVRLGAPGQIHAVDVDTRFFDGNHPTACCVEACVAERAADLTEPAVPWIPLVEHADLQPNSHNVLPVCSRRRWTHVRLRLACDGGVARLRVYGHVIPDPADWEGVTVEVSGVEQGGRVEWSSDSFYADAAALVAPDRPRTMGDGWEARRRRDLGPDTHDAAIISFAAAADLHRLEIDTTWFLFNASTHVAVLGSRSGPDDRNGWAKVAFDVPVLPKTALVPAARHVFRVRATDVVALRVAAYPDGGLARVRALGTPTTAGVEMLTRRWEASA